jgi:hypothetical protein
VTAKVLLMTGVVWFAAVAVWLRFSPGFSFFWMLPKNGFKQAAIIGAFYVATASYTLFLVGWIVPLSLGAYRLVSKH